MAKFTLYLGVSMAYPCILTSLGMNIVISMAAVAACIGNIGPGIGTVGPTENYAHMHGLAK